MSMKHPIRPACVGYTPGPPENQSPPQVGQDDLFGALEAELGHIDLIRNFSLVSWNLEVNLHQIIPWGWLYMTILELGHADLLRDLSVKYRNGSH